MSTNDKPNLARIRENQRRSRARRKEYLQELEARWRRCEQAGAEASSEIQAAARKVADENKRLRLLLKERGVQEHEVTDYLARTGGGPHACGPAQDLDRLLSTRRSCGNGDCDDMSGEQKQTPWRPVWTEAPPQPSQPPPASLTEAQPQFQPTRCNSTVLGCCSAESLQSQTGSVYGRDYPQINQSVELRGFARVGYHIPGGNPHAISYSAATGQTSSLITNDAMPHLAYETTNTGAIPLAPNLGCAPGNDCKAQNGGMFTLTDQYASHSVRL